MKNENLIIYLDYQDILTFCSGHLLYKEAYAYADKSTMQEYMNKIKIYREGTTRRW